MIIPSIDIQQGQAVQLIGGKTKALDAGDPIAVANNFSITGELAVIDLDAALNTGSNEETIKNILPMARCRVGGGIRTVEKAISWLDKGAHRIILGTTAKPELLSQLPKERIIAALDCVHREVYIEGWQQPTGRNIFDEIKILEPYVSGFLITMIEREGRMVGTDLSFVKTLREAISDNQSITIAGGIAATEEIALLDNIGVDAQIGMALYTGAFSIADSIEAIIACNNPKKLWPTVVTNEAGIALGLVYSNNESLKLAIEKRQGIYFSRKRGIWEKGATSGNSQRLLRVELDCDRDALRFVVEQTGSGFCHNNTDTCWGDTAGISRLAKRVAEYSTEFTSDLSYTKRLLNNPTLLKSKLIEEALELAESTEEANVIHEASDLLYFLLVKLRTHQIPLSAIDRELEMRSLKITRRAGNAKPIFL